MELRKLKFWEKSIDPAMDHWHRQCEMTPDIWKLEQYHRQLIFVADDMQTGGKNNKLVAEASFTAEPAHPTVYTHHKYTFWKKDLGVHSYTIILPEGYRPTGFVRYPVEPARIRGELWAIRPSQFILLDKHKQNGVQFKRDRVRIKLPSRFVCYDDKRPLPNITDQPFHTVTAWLYTGVPDYWDAQIGGIFASSQMETQDHTAKAIQKFYSFDIKDL